MKELYRFKHFPIGVFLLIITCSMVTIPTMLNHDLYYVYASNGSPVYFWQGISGIFEHSISPSWFIYPHFFGNMSMVLIFGLLVENVLGTKKFLMASLFGVVANMTFFHIRYFGVDHSLSGASVMTYVYVPIAIYIIYQYYQQATTKPLKDGLFYLFLAELVFTWGFITINSSFWGTNVYHLIATIVGCFFTLYYHQTIKKNVLSSPSYTLSRRAKLILLVIPACLLSLNIAYQSNLLTKLFLTPISISQHGNYEEINDNNKQIILTFDEEILGFYSTYTSGLDEVKITTSEDNKEVIIDFPNGITRPAHIRLERGKGTNGKRLNDIELNINK